MPNKRITTKVGDVYRTKETNHLVQLAALDPINLNSDVIIVYRSGTSLSDIDENNAQYEFYTHTTVSEGASKELWQKIGKASVPDTKELRFKNFRSEEQNQLEAEVTGETTHLGDSWAIWSPSDTERKTVSLEDGQKIAAENGAIYPPEDVIYRIQKGKSGFASNWPQ